MEKVTQVAIGLILYKGCILVGWRNENLHQGGCYEFPGGKVEIHETPECAVIREIKEEVNIDVVQPQLFHTLQFTYPDKTLKLFFYKLYLPSSTKIDSEQWQWIEIDHLRQFKFPSANKAIVDRLGWYRQLAVTPDFNTVAELYNLDTPLELIYLRLPNLTKDDYLMYFQLLIQSKQCIVRLHDYQQLDHQCKSQVFAIHMNMLQMKEINKRDYPNINFIAACHCFEDIMLANTFGCDAILLSPVLPTATHPEQCALGWEEFARLAKHAQMPVYALGGIHQQDLQLAQQYGAYGVAGIRDFWQINERLLWSTDSL